MPKTDIGPRIGLDGEKEFRASLASIGQQMKTLGTEMKAVTSAFDANDKSQENLAAQADVLNRQIALQEQRLSEVQRALDYARQNYDENSTEVQRWTQVMNNATADLNQLRSQLSKTEQEMGDLGDETEDAADAMEDMEQSGSGLGSTLRDAFLGGGIAGAIQSVVSGIMDLVESTTEYRRIMASLEVSSERAGYTAEETAQTYRTLYGVLGDDQTAATTTSNLQAIGLAQEQLNDITNAAIGAWATYGDSIPIDGLAEAINETIQVGQVTGTFADALNWAGVSEDEFNARLEGIQDPAERANLVLQQLASQGLVEAGEAWQQNNADIVAANQATASLSDTMAGFGAVLSPIVTTAKTGFADLLSGVLGVVQAFQTGGFNAAFATAGELVSGFAETIIKQAPAMMKAGGQMILDLVSGLSANLPEIASAAGDAIQEFLGFLSENLPTIIESGAEILGSLVAGIISAIPDFLAQLPKIIVSFTEFVAANLPSIAKAGVNILLQLIAGIVSAIPELAQVGPSILAAIRDGIYSLIGGMVEVGTAIVTGLWEGISGAAGWLLNKIKGWANSILDSIKGFFGIHSPSAVFRDDVGRYMAQGIGVGFEDEMGAVASRMQRSIPTPTVSLGDELGRLTSALSPITQSTGAQTINLSIELDGAVLARKQYKYNARESTLRGASLVEVPTL